MMNNKKGFVLTEVILMIMVIGLALMMISGQNKKALDKVSVILENAGRFPLHVFFKNRR